MKVFLEKETGIRLGYRLKLQTPYHCFKNSEHETRLEFMVHTFLDFGSAYEILTSRSCSTGQHRCTAPAPALNTRFEMLKSSAPRFRSRLVSRPVSIQLERVLERSCLVI